MLGDKEFLYIYPCPICGNFHILRLQYDWELVEDTLKHYKTMTEDDIVGDMESTLYASMERAFNELHPLHKFDKELVVKVDNSEPA